MVMRLADWRKQRMLTQRQLAAQAQVCYTSLARLECGHRRAPHFATIRKLAAALDVAPADVAEFRAALGLPADSDAA